MASAKPGSRPLYGFFPLVFAVFAVAGTMGQTPDESARRFSYLPLVADGEGIRSTLLITNVADSSNSCSLVFLSGGLDSGDFETHDRLRADGARATVDLPDYGSHVSIVSKDGPVLTFDSATLDCAEPAVTRVLITLSAGSALQAAATLPGAGIGTAFSFPVAPRVGENFLLAYNHHGAEVNCRFEIADEAGVVVGERSHVFPGRASIVRGLAQLAPAPAGFDGGSAKMSCDRQIAVTGMLLGSALSGMPPAVLAGLPIATAPTAPDLVVVSASASNASPETGQSFTLRATVRNDGDGQAGSTTLRYYRSADATISSGDTQVGTDGVGVLGALAESPESIALTAPSTAGTYYYGACVDSVAGESGTGNNCSSGVRVTVSSATTNPPSEDGACVEANDVVELGEGESCTITQALVDKYSLDSVSVNAGLTASCSGGAVRINNTFWQGVTIQINSLTFRCR